MNADDLTPAMSDLIAQAEAELATRANAGRQKLAALIGPNNLEDVLAAIFEAAALAGYSVPEYVAGAAHTATERLPRGMALTDQRPGCWESDLFEQMVPQSAIMEGPGPDVVEVECPRCYAAPGEPCFRLDTYAPTKHPHRDRVKLCREPLAYIDGAWM